MRCALFLLLCAAALAQTAPQRALRQGRNLPPLTTLQRATEEGRNLSSEQAADLENLVAAQPSNEEARARLLGYYFALIRRDLVNAPPEARDARGRHVRWLIENTPRSELLSRPECFAMSGFSEDGANYKMARELWLEQTDRYPTDAQVLLNAILLLQQRDRLRALQLMKRRYELSAASDDSASYFGVQLGLAVLGSGGDGLALRGEALKQLEAVSDPRVLASTAATIVNYTRNAPALATNPDTEALIRKLLKQAMTNSGNPRLIRMCQGVLDRLDREVPGPVAR